MCDPYSTMQNNNLAKGGLTEARILDMRKSHAKLVDWIAKQERWQREVNKGHWLGEQPEKCGSWNLRATQEMQRDNFNTVFDMCNEDAAGLKDPPTHRPIRKRTKLSHSSGILHMRFKDWKCPGHTNHRQIEGQTKMRLADGTWKSIKTSVFAGWYARRFCDNVIPLFEAELNN